MGNHGSETACLKRKNKKEITQLGVPKKRDGYRKTVYAGNTEIERWIQENDAFLKDKSRFHYIEKHSDFNARPGVMGWDYFYDSPQVRVKTEERYRIKIFSLTSDIDRYFVLSTPTRN
jgi:hypothetical protein